MFTSLRVYGLNGETGTGILAILADKLGAANIVAVGKDNNSIENAAEIFFNNNNS